MKELHKYKEKGIEHFVAIDCENDKLQGELCKLNKNNFILYSIFAFCSFRDIQFQLDVYIYDTLKGGNKFDSNSTTEEKLKLIDRLINSIDFDFQIEEQWGPSINEYLWLPDDTKIIDYFFDLSNYINEYKKILTK